MITPITPVVIPPYPTSTVQPFTYKDGLSYLDRLEMLQKYINRILIPFVNDSYNELSSEVKDQVNALIVEFNAALQGVLNATSELTVSVTAQLAEQNTDVASQLAEQNATFNAVVESVINSSIQLQDTVLKAIIANPSSASGIELRQRFSETFVLFGPGIDPTGTSDSTSAIQAIIDKAALVRGKVSVPAGTFLVSTLDIKTIMMEGESGGLIRYGTGGNPSAGSTFKQISGTTTPLFNVTAYGGVTLKNVYLDVNGNVADGLRVRVGFEHRYDTVRVFNSKAWGVDLYGSANTSYKDLFIDNCANGLRIGSRNSAAANTIDFEGLTIERCSGVHLDIGATAGFCEFVRINRAHIEATTDSGGVANTGPVVQIGYARGVTFVNPFIYGGSGVLIEHDRASATAQTSGIAGVTILGGQLLGRNLDTGLQPSTLVSLKTGNQFSIIGTRFNSYSQYAVTVDSAYGDTVIVSSILYDTNLLSDARTARRANTEIWGDFLAKNKVTIQNHLVATTTTPNLISSTDAPCALVGNDVRGNIFFGSHATNAPVTGPQVILTYAEAYSSEAIVVITPGNAAAAALNAYVSTTPTGFTIACRNAPASAGLANTAHQFKYHVIG